jgi:hypothetical protein
MISIRVCKTGLCLLVSIMSPLYFFLFIGLSPNSLSPHASKRSQFHSYSGSAELTISTHLPTPLPTPLPHARSAAIRHDRREEQSDEIRKRIGTPRRAMHTGRRDVTATTRCCARTENHNHQEERKKVLLSMILHSKARQVTSRITSAQAIIKAQYIQRYPTLLPAWYAWRG